MNFFPLSFIEILTGGTTPQILGKDSATTLHWRDTCATTHGGFVQQGSGSIAQKWSIWTNISSGKRCTGGKSPLCISRKRTHMMYWRRRLLSSGLFLICCRTSPTSFSAPRIAFKIQVTSEEFSCPLEWEVRDETKGGDSSDDCRLSLLRILSYENV